MRFRTLRSIPILALTLGLLAASGAEAGSIYSAADLGSNVSGLSLNNVGQVAGTRTTPQGPNGFLYSQDRFTDLSPDVRPINLTDTGRVIDTRGPYAFWYGSDQYRNVAFVDGVIAGNHNGALIGSAHQDLLQGPNDPGPFETNFVFRPDAKPVDPATIDYRLTWDSTARANLGLFPFSYGSANGDAKIVASNDPTGHGIMNDIGPTSQPVAINDSNQILANNYPSYTLPTNKYGYDYQYSHHAFIFDFSAPNQDLGTLGGATSYGAAINNAGQVTGSADTASGASHAFLYTGGKMIDLGLLPGMASSEGLGLNGKGDVVGTSGSHAFLFSNGIMEDLNDRLPATMGLTLDRAIAINDAGQIVAYGHGADGVEHGYLAGGLSRCPSRPRFGGARCWRWVGFGAPTAAPEFEGIIGRSPRPETHIHRTRYKKIRSWAWTLTTSVSLLPDRAASGAARSPGRRGRTGAGSWTYRRA